MRSEEGGLSSLQFISPFKCRMWDLHDRLGEDLNTASCTTLIESIRLHGQKRPALGRAVRRADAYEVELLYGARRLFAARHLGVDLLVDVRDIDDRAALIEMDIENRLREDISPYERGISYKRWLREGYFANQAEISKCLGVSEAQVSRLLRYADLPAAIVTAFPSPRDIREEWAVTIAKTCGDEHARARIIRKARACSRLKGRYSSQQIYDSLLAAERRSVPATVRDRVIKGPTGAPVLRIAFRRKAVHLIVSRDNLSPAMLERIAGHVRDVLASDRQDENSDTARVLVTGDVAPNVADQRSGVDNCVQGVNVLRV